MVQPCKILFGVHAGKFPNLDCEIGCIRGGVGFAYSSLETFLFFGFGAAR